MKLQDKILLVKGILQFIGLLIMLWAFVWMLRHSEYLQECFVYDGNGETQPTGLYGNCSYIKADGRIFYNPTGATT